MHTYGHFISSKGHLSLLVRKHDERIMKNNDEEGIMKRGWLTKYEEICFHYISNNNNNNNRAAAMNMQLREGRDLINERGNGGKI